MKKSDLKTGMVVETRSGEKYLVMLNPDCGGRDLISFHGGFMQLEGYDEDLILKNGQYKDDFTIDKIYSARNTIAFLLNDIDKMDLKLIWERLNPILDEAERKYLRAVIKPFRNSIQYIMKRMSPTGEVEDILIKHNDTAIRHDCFCLPSFPKGAMYEGMELRKQYTLEELGL